MCSIHWEEATDLAYCRLWNADDEEIMNIPYKYKIMYLHTLTQTCQIPPPIRQPLSLRQWLSERQY